MPEDVSLNSAPSLLENLNKLPDVHTTDASFLKLLMDSPIIKSLVKAHDVLGNKIVSPEANDASGIVDHVLHDIHETKSNVVADLACILQDPHMLGLVKAHDVIAKQHLHHLSYRYTPCKVEPAKAVNRKDAVRMIGLSRRQGESLGLMVQVKDQDVVVTRIFHGGLVHKQGLLTVGDIIKEVNGQLVKGSPDLLKEYLSKPNASYILKVIPSYKQSTPECNMFIRCNYNYCANTDPLMPSANAGLSFQEKDILQVVDHSDQCWWQARHVNEKGEPCDRAGLIPSIQLQEHRFVSRKAMLHPTHKPVCAMYKISDCSKLDSEQCNMYQEVTHMPAFVRKVIVLLCDDRSIAFKVKLQITMMFKDQYKAAVIHTSDQQKQTDTLYSILTQEEMLSGIKANEYLEVCQQGKEMYGTKYEAIRNVMKSKKVCVHIMTAKNLKFVMNSEFMPYVVLLSVTDNAAIDPDDHDCEITKYSYMINSTIPFTSVEETCTTLHKHLRQINSQSQWLPVSWVY